MKTAIPIRSRLLSLAMAFFIFLTIFNIIAIPEKVNAVGTINSVKYTKLSDGGVQIDITVTPEVKNSTVGNAYPDLVIFTPTDNSFQHLMNNGTGRMTRTFVSGSTTYKDQSTWKLVAYPPEDGTWVVSARLRDTSTGVTRYTNASSTTLTGLKYNRSAASKPSVDVRFANPNASDKTRVDMLTYTWYAGSRRLTNLSYYRGDANGNNGVLVKSISGDDIDTKSGYTCAYTGLTPGTTYTFWYTATNAIGTTTSTKHTATPGTPSAPTNLKSLAGNKQVTYTWDPPTSLNGSTIAGYNVYWNTTVTPLNGTTLISPSSRKYVRTFTNNGATTGSYLRVCAVTTDGKQGTIATCPNVWVGSPQAPTTLTVGPNNKSGQLSVSWSASATSNSGIAATSYIVYYNGTSKTVSGTTATLTGLTNGKSYNVQVAGVNANGTGLKSAASAGIPRTNPAVPTNLTATATGKGQVTLSWTPGAANDSALTGYVITGGVASQNTAAAGAKSVNITGLANGATYNFKIYAKNSGLNSSTVNFPAVTTWNVPSKPAAPSVTFTGNGTTATLKWNAPANNGSTISGYTIGGLSGATAKVDVANCSATVTGLSLGTTYNFTVTATNAVGNSSASDKTTVTTWKKPSQVTGVTVEPTNEKGKLKVTWTKPDNGGEAIDSYKVYRDGGNAVTVTGENTLTTTLTGLNNGQNYGITVAAVNAAGEGPASISVPGTPRNAPGAPATAEAVVQKDGTEALVSWTAPSDNGGNAIDNYVIIDNATKAVLGSPTSSPYTVTGLSKGTQYTFAVAAVNDAGTGTYKTTNTLTTWREPDAPTNVKASVPTSTSVELTWDAPENNGGTSITDYVITGAETDSNISVDVENNKAVITGLKKNTEYTFTVAAVNAAGTGAASDTVNAKTLIAPSQPGIKLEATDRQIKVTITPPEDDGGVPLTAYSVKYKVATSEEVTTETASGTTHIISPLENGVDYEVWVVANNEADLHSVDSEHIIDHPKTVPSAPGNVIATVTGKTTVNLTWEKPDNGGDAINNYTVQSYTDGTGNGTWTHASNVTTTSAEITGLTENTVYTFRVIAHNDGGDSQPAVSNEVKTWTDPGVPGLVTVTPTNESGELKVTWQKPFDGNAKILGYTVYVDGTPAEEDLISADTNEYIITGLTDGKNYTITVSATNEADEGEKSAELSATPRSKPGKPSILSVISGDKQAFVNITAPENNGGDAVTSYRIFVDGNPQRTVKANEVENVAISNLSNNTSYSIQVAAINAAGEGDLSDPATVLVGMPLAPTNVKLVPGNSKVTVSYDASEGNGSPITEYKFYIENEFGEKFETSVTGEELEAVLEDLENGVKYTISVSAVNRVGESGKSEAVSVVAGTPTAPEIESVVIGADNVKVTWTPSTSVGNRMRGYNIYLNGEKYNEDFAATATEATLTGLETGKPYTLEVAGWNIAGEGPKSAAYEFVFGAPAAPTLDAVDAVSGKLVAKWTAGEAFGSEITSFVIYVDGKPYIEDIPATAESYDITGLAYGTEYEIQVAAINGNGEGEKSNIVVAKPFTNASAPTNVIATVKSSTTVELTWVPPINDGGNEITGYTVRGAGNAKVNGTTALISELEPNKEYVFYVSAKNAANNGPETASEPVTTWTVPDMPVIESAVSGVGSVELNWKKPEFEGGTPITNYNVYVEGIKVNKEPVTGTTFTINNLDDGIYYYIEVTSENIVGESERANAGLVAPGMATVPVISSVVAGDKSATVTWNPSKPNSTSISGYRVYLNGNPRAFVSNATQYTFTGLTNSQEYTITVAAMCSMGETEKSAPVTVIPGTVASPLSVKAEADNASINVSWTPRAEADVTHYVIYVDGVENMTVPAADEEGVLASGATITNLVNQEYTITVGSKNGNGIGSLSEPVKATPYTRPDAPVIKSIESGNESFTITYTEPKNNGKPIDEYKIYVNGSAVKTSTELTAVVDGVKNGEDLVVTVTAVNEGGESNHSLDANFRVGVPGSTEITSVVIGDRNVVVNFSEAAQNGGKITQYNIYVEEAAEEGVEQQAEPRVVTVLTGTSCTIDELENGKRYSLTIEAQNSLGKGPRSAPYYTVPGASSEPIISSAIPADKSVDLSWKRPLENYSGIIKYFVYVNDQFYRETTEMSMNVEGLVNGREYSFTVSAVNDIGESAKSEPVVEVPYTYADAPQSVEVVATGPDKAKITWKAPATNGGKEITEYVVVGEGDKVVDNETLSAEITGLTKGGVYTYSVYAVNERGDGAKATADPVKTWTEPGAPTPMLIETGEKSLSLEWDLPADDGGTEILGYNVLYKEGRDGELKQSNPEGELVTEYPYIITGLTNGVTYYVYMTAENSVGESTISGGIAGIPRGNVQAVTPDAPKSVTATAGDTTILVEWEEPVFNGNSPIRGYHVYLNGAKLTTEGYVDSTARAYLIEGLTNGYDYTVSVSSVNGVGEGPKFEPAVTATPEEPPVINKPGKVPDDGFTYVVTPDKQNAVLTWTAPSDDGGSKILGYQIYSSNQPVNGLDELIDDTEYVFPIEFNATYYISVAAVNAAGAGTPSKNIVVRYDLNNDDDGDGDADSNIDDDGNGEVDEEPEAPPVTPPAEDEIITTPGETTNLEGEVGEDNTTITLTWTAPENTGGTDVDITGYELYVTNKTAQTPTETVEIDGNVATYDFAGEENTEYVFQIAAVNEKGAGAKSAPLTISTVPTVKVTYPDAPTELTATVDGTNVELKWVAPENNGNSELIGYVVYVNDGEGIEVEGKDATTYTYAGEAASTYTFRVAAKNAVAVGLKSDIVAATTYTDEDYTDIITPDAIGAPVNLAAEVAETTVTLTWEAPEGDGTVDSYALFVNGAKYDTENKITETTYEFAGEQDSYYTFQVAAVTLVDDAEVIGALSAPVAATTAIDEEPVVEEDTTKVPGAPTSLATVVKEGTSQITVTWKAPSNNGGLDITDYVVYINGDEGTPLGDIATTYTFTGEEDKEYVIEIAAVNAKGEGGKSAAYTATIDKNVDTDDDGEPDKNVDINGDGEPDKNIEIKGAPGAPEITGTVSDAINTIKVIWTAPEDGGTTEIISYNVYVNNTLKGEVDVATARAGEKYSYLITPATSATIEITVAAVNGSGEGKKSNVWTTNVALNTTDDIESDEPTGGFDKDGDGILDSLAGTTYKLSGSVVFTASKNPAKVRLLNQYGIPVSDGEIEVSNGGTFEFSVTFKPSDDLEQLFTLEVTGEKATTATVSDISFSSGDVAIGNPLEIYYGNFNTDNRITGADLSVILTNYNKSSTEYDLTGDGRVTGADLSVILTNYNKRSD